MAYLNHIDLLVELTIEKINQVNLVQLYLLATNGVACGLAAATVAWIAFSRLLAFRLAIYHTFLAVPMAMLRSLAVSALLTTCSSALHVHEQHRLCVLRAACLTRACRPARRS